MRFKFDYGLELTFHVEEWTKELVQNLAWLKRDLLSVTESWGKRRGHVYVEKNENQIEIKSPVIQYREELIRYYSAAREFADNNSLVVRTTRVSSGGGHLHVSSKTITNLPIFAKWIMLDAINKPWLTWVFCDPEDDTESMWLGYFYNAIAKNKLWLGKRSAVQFNSILETIELRFFEAPQNLDEQLLHINFADTWLDWCTQKFNSGFIPVIEDTPTLKGWTKRRILSEFKNFLSEIGLDYSDYKDVAERNVTARIFYKTLN